MKIVSILLFVLFFGMTIKGFSQGTPADFFPGKWEISILGTPNGDSKLKIQLTRKDGKLTGQLTDPTGNPIQIEELIEESGKITIGFAAEGMSLSIDLKKVDDNSMKGSLMSGRFDAKAVRLKD
jgi:hypothetical protein